MKPSQIIGKVVVDFGLRQIDHLLVLYLLVHNLWNPEDEIFRLGLNLIGYQAIII